MSAKQSVKLFSYYMILIGLGFIFLPNTILGIFSLASTNEVWIRFVGLFAFVVGYFYYGSMVRNNVKEFFAATVRGRLVFGAGTLIFTLLGLLGKGGYIFGIFEILCALYTGSLLKKEAKQMKKA
jgi:hypothetical protein